jgi:hypothetical protein
MIFAKSEKELKQEELTAILGRAEIIIGRKIARNMTVFDADDGKYTIFLKYDGQDLDCEDRMCEIDDMLLDNTESILGKSKFYNLVSVW